MEKYMNNLSFVELKESNIDEAVKLFVEYFNITEKTNWTYDKAFRRIHEAITKEDSLSLMILLNQKVVGFEMGYLEQYEDGLVFDLHEIVIAKAYQRKGYGKALLTEAMKRAKDKGAFLCQLIAINDAAHDKFYSSLGIQNCTNLVLKSRII
jgi:ribosomal protein S18 acetylase RimI-like enzyme